MLITGSIGVTHSYSIRLFLWALGHQSNCIPVGHSLYTQLTRPFLCFVSKCWVWLVRLGHTLQARTSRFFIGFGTAFRVSTFLTLDVTQHQPVLKSSPMQVVFAIKYWWQWRFGNEATFRGIMGQYVNLVQSNYQALWAKAVKKLMGKLSEPCLSYD